MEIVRRDTMANRSELPGQRPARSFATSPHVERAHRRRRSETISQPFDENRTSLGLARGGDFGLTESARRREVAKAFDRLFESAL
jgi:hypothetical protein